jgi:hypothetical protein
MFTRLFEIASSSHGLAVAALRQQAEIFGFDAISLDSLWRAAGSPPGKDPREWSRIALSLVRGFDDYLAEVARLQGHPRGGHPVLWEWHANDGDPWRSGDLMSAFPLAQLYAAYLDGGIFPSPT